MGDAMQRHTCSTVAWGRNREDGVGTDAFLAETSLDLDQRNTMFGRAEIVEKTGADLVLPEELEEAIYTTGKLEGGYLRRFGTFASVVPGIGATLSVSFVPDPLRPFHDNRASVGFSVFFNLRPAAMARQMGHQHQADTGGMRSPGSSATPAARRARR